MLKRGVEPSDRVDAGGGNEVLYKHKGELI
jgi:hypothetical protein